MYLWSDCGVVLNMRRSISRLMKTCRKPELKSVDTWPSTTPNAHIHRLTDKPPIRLTSIVCRQSRSQHNRGRNPLIEKTKLVQKNRTTSDYPDTSHSHLSIIGADIWKADSNSLTWATDDSWSKSLLHCIYCVLMLRTTHSESWRGFNNVTGGLDSYWRSNL